MCKSYVPQIKQRGRQLSLVPQLSQLVSVKRLWQTTLLLLGTCVRKLGFWLVYNQVELNKNGLQSSLFRLIGLQSSGKELKHENVMKPLRVSFHNVGKFEFCARDQMRAQNHLNHCATSIYLNIHIQMCFVSFLPSLSFKSPKNKKNISP